MLVSQPSGPLRGDGEVGTGRRPRGRDSRVGRAATARSLAGDLGADSLDTVELVMALEEEFETEIPDEEAEKITTVQQAIDYVQANS